MVNVVLSMKKKINNEHKRESKRKGLLIEVKIYEKDMQRVDDKEIGFKVFQLMLPLLKLWKQDYKIDGIHALNNDLIENENEFSKKMEWATQPKLMRRNKCILGQMMVHVKTESSAINCVLNYT